MSGPVYLDYAASWPVHPRVAETMADCLGPEGPHANPSSSHAEGRRAAQVIEQARESVAALIGAAPKSIVFTSGATESDNLAILGAARAGRDRGRHLVTSRIEHRAVVDAFRQLEHEGFEVTWLRPGPDGRVAPQQVEDAIRPETLLVSVMHGNNETGTVNDVAAIGTACRVRGVLFHVDAAQGAGKVPVDVEAWNADLVAFTAHKLGGPKGIGALYVRAQPRPALQPLQFGGGQERGLRAGTLATHQVAGFGVACELARADLPEEERRVRGLRERLWAHLQTVGGTWRNGSAEASLPGILNVGFAGIEGESLFLALDGKVLASSGSACNSASAQPSHVLRALGLSDLACQASLRLSLGRWSTEADVQRAADAVAEAVARLRSLAPAAALERIR
ncbi:MAG: cysteine desulfurase [Proteobacteria bacterium]|nr:cysteine desulfurase [Pseudomonadota bacterium]